MNSLDFCAIYQLVAVNLVVVTQSQESGGMKKRQEEKNSDVLGIRATMH